MSMAVRSATAADVPDMHRVRLAVRENQLSDLTAINEGSYLTLIEAGGAWVVELNEGIAGFAIVDASTANVWALFVSPDAEGLGIGRALHDNMLRWAREQGLLRLSLTTSPGTRAESFYRRLGWSEIGFTDGGETLFEHRLSSLGNTLRRPD